MARTNKEQAAQATLTATHEAYKKALYGKDEPEALRLALLLVELTQGTLLEARQRQVLKRHQQ